jgi:hypothetical protein
MGTARAGLAYALSDPACALSMTVRFIWSIFEDRILTPYRAVD